MEVTHLWLYHSSPSLVADFFDASHDAPSPQVIEFAFSLEVGEEFEVANVKQDGETVASFDFQGNYQRKH